MLDMAKEMTQVGVPYEATGLSDMQHMLNGANEPGKSLVIVYTSQFSGLDNDVETARTFYGYLPKDEAKAVAGALTLRRSVRRVHLVHHAEVL